MDDDIPYLLLTPGPLTTSRSVREAMLRDYCTWDQDYNAIVNQIRGRLVALAGATEPTFTSVLMQGSGTFVVESVVGTAIPSDGHLLVLDNGAYGQRIRFIAERLKIRCTALEQPEVEPADVERLRHVLSQDPTISHVAAVHCETTTGMLNPLHAIAEAVAASRRSLIVDAMSSFGGIPLSVAELPADYLISSANKCIQGTPGFGFVVARRSALEAAAGQARSLSLDLYDQWREMESRGGKWRYTSPTHVVRAFQQALLELAQEGGPAARHARYRQNQRLLVEGLGQLGFQPLLAAGDQSPFITAFREPGHPAYTFEAFYQALKRRRFVIYPGKVSRAATFRIGTIGHVFPDDIRLLLQAVREALEELGITLTTVSRQP